MNPWLACGLLCAPMLLADAFMAATVVARAEFAGSGALLALHMANRVLGDCTVVLLGCALLLRLAPAWLGRYAWPLAYSALAWVDGAIYYFSQTVLDVYHFALISWAFIARFGGPFLFAACAALLAVDLGYVAAMRRGRPRLSFTGVAAAGLCVGALAAANLPWWLEERPNLADDTPAAMARQGRSQRLRQVTRLPLALLPAALQRDPWRVARPADLQRPEVQATLQAHRLPLGRSPPAPLGLKPFRTVVLVTTESLSLQLLGGYNPALPAALAPFYNRPAVRAHLHTDYFTSAAPTRQGLLSTFTSHPNSALTLAMGEGLSWVRQLRGRGFSTTFLKGDSRYYSPETHLLNRLGFDQVIAREELLARPSCARYTRGAGVPDRCVYDALLEQLAQQGAGRHFYALLGVDTHPGTRERYADLPYPNVDGLLPPGPAQDTLRGAAWHDDDMRTLWSELQSLPAFGDDFLLILTADHCRPSTPELDAVPGYEKDALCRIPLALLTPQPLPAMQAGVASQVDLAPTLMHLLDAPALPGWWGASLFDPAKDNPAVGLQQRALVLRPTPQTHQGMYVDDPRSDDERALAQLVDSLYSEAPTGTAGP